MTDYDKMDKAYKASKKIFDIRMESERKEDLEVLNAISDNEILIVPGQYDRVEQVFDLFQIRYAIVSPNQLKQVTLHPSQTLIINCPGDGIQGSLLKKIKQFVEDGGFLFTTDWVLKNVLEQIFPEFVRYNGLSTADEVVPVEVVDVTHPYLKGLFPPGADPLWWLEGSSYPIQIVDQGRVKVLVQSRAIAKKYGEAPAIITFSHGKGTVLHMISHYYLQRAELRTERHKANAADYAKELNIPAAVSVQPEFKDVTLGEAESAYTNAQFMANVMIERKKEMLKREKAAGETTTQPKRKKSTKPAKKTGKV